MRVLNVIIGCEFSGVVRRAFRERGHDAYSCDLLPAEDGSKHHIQADHDLHLLDVCASDPKWDLGIFHPPCTYLCNSGVRWLYGGKGKIVDPARWSEMEHAADFFKALLNCGIPRVCVENPIPHSHAMHRIGASYSQIVHPWQFGHNETKGTCLWLKNLPLLVPTDIVDGRTPRVHHASPGPERWKERSRTLSGIAAAMSEQWSV